MSLREQVQHAVQTGIAALQDLAERATYVSVAATVYDPTAGTMLTPSAPFQQVPMVWTSFSRREIDGEAVLAEDQKVIVATEDLLPIPTINDTITRADGTKWSVIRITTDPAGAAWVLQVRKP